MDEDILKEIVYYSNNCYSEIFGSDNRQLKVCETFGIGKSSHTIMPEVKYIEFGVFEDAVGNVNHRKEKFDSCINRYIIKFKIDEAFNLKLTELYNYIRQKISCIPTVAEIEKTLSEHLKNGYFMEIAYYDYYKGRDEPTTPRLKLTKLLSSDEEHKAHLEQLSELVNLFKDRGFGVKLSDDCSNRGIVGLQGHVHKYSTFCLNMMKK